MLADASRFVFDSFALFAHFEGEAGGPIVRRLLDRADSAEATIALSVINLGEAAYITEREQGPQAVKRLLAAVNQLPIRVVEADRRRTLAAAHLKAHYPIAYADAFALALAMELSATLVTGDAVFRAVESEAPILWLPR